MSDQPKEITRGVRFGTSGVGGILAWWVVHPFNTLAVRMNLANLTTPGGLNQSLPAFASGIVKNEGVGSLYKGIGAGTARQVFYATSRFGLFEEFRDKIAAMRGGQVDMATRIVAGGASGGAAALISCPCEVSLVRMSNDQSLPAEKRRNYKNVVDAFMRITREEGPTAFWRGATPFCTRAIIVGVFQVAFYDQFKQLYANKLGMKYNGTTNVASAAFTAGFIYAFMTNPLETSKNRMAFQKPNAEGVLPYRGVAQTIMTVGRAEGVGALWNGFLPYWGRCGGHTVGMFIIVEKLRELYLKS